jgi:hypothetical protein
MLNKVLKMNTFKHAVHPCEDKRLISLQPPVRHARIASSFAASSVFENECIGCDYSSDTLIRQKWVTSAIGIPGVNSMMVCFKRPYYVKRICEDAFPEKCATLCYVVD